MSVRISNKGNDGYSRKVTCDACHKKRIREEIEKLFESLKKGDELPPHYIDETEDGLEFYCKGFSVDEDDHLQDAIDAIVRPDIKFTKFDCYVGTDENGASFIDIDYSGTMTENIESRIRRIVWGNRLYRDLSLCETDIRCKLLKTNTHCTMSASTKTENKLHFVITFLDLCKEKIPEKILNKILETQSRRGRPYPDTRKAIDSVKRDIRDFICELKYGDF